MADEILKKRREELGKDLKEIGRILKIRGDYLKAIEDEHFEKLPVEVYAKGYIREYARFLNIEPEIIIKSYIEKMSPSAPVTEKHAPPEIVGPEIIKEEPETPKAKSYGVPLIIILLVVSAVYIIFSFFNAPEKPAAPQPEKTMPSTLPEQQARPDHDMDTKTDDIKKSAAADLRQEKILKGHTLEILASDTTWLLINIDDAETKDMLLNPGDSVKFSAKQSFSLKIGNAGGIKLVFDGKDMGVFGEKGKVVTLNLPDVNNASLNMPR